MLVVLTNDVKNVPFVEIKTSFGARYFMVIRSFIIKMSPNPNLALSEYSFAVGGNNFKRNRALGVLLKIRS